MSSIPPLRTFFEQELGTSDDALRRFGLDEAVSTEHVVSHLVERTVRRAALDAATHRHSIEYPTDGPKDVSWKQCLMVAALTELRPVKLLARN
ncbi:MAG: hypothetical protein ABEK84_03260 [Salinibacter sp.]